jgi:hypothetical protein
MNHRNRIHRCDDTSYDFPLNAYTVALPQKTSKQLCVMVVLRRIQNRIQNGVQNVCAVEEEQDLAEPVKKTKFKNVKNAKHTPKRK